jgi:hypothetical protein
MTFAELKLDPRLQRAIADRGIFVKSFLADCGFKGKTPYEALRCKLV